MANCNRLLSTHGSLTPTQGQAESGLDRLLLPTQADSDNEDWLEYFDFEGFTGSGPAKDVVCEDKRVSDASPVDDPRVCNLDLDVPASVDPDGLRALARTSSQAEARHDDHQVAVIPPTINHALSISTRMPCVDRDDPMTASSSILPKGATAPFCGVHHDTYPETTPPAPNASETLHIHHDQGGLGRCSTCRTTPGVTGGISLNTFTGNATVTVDCHPPELIDLTFSASGLGGEALQRKSKRPLSNDGNRQAKMPRNRRNCMNLRAQGVRCVRG
ncbi:Uu.00g130140.m01.CDS01 [Anthostomella pinea]|uniref:Uu.00g130140.m01.CDS01 n=1 Tax=Anthostomella pinea TaxID=933095 RepID=A0AAI8VJK5_9PEZI|nr:Uu.00g130140.m01.CDS01 [Anthostomella pinea]